MPSQGARPWREQVAFAAGTRLLGHVLDGLGCLLNACREQLQGLLEIFEGLGKGGDGAGSGRAVHKLGGRAPKLTCTFSDVVGLR